MGSVCVCVCVCVCLNKQEKSRKTLKKLITLFLGGNFWYILNVEGGG